jgi:hypothetical protein
MLALPQEADFDAYDQKLNSRKAGATKRVVQAQFNASRRIV